MQAQVNIEFDQLVELAKQLPSKQWTKLKKEVEEKTVGSPQDSDLVSLLLSAPTFSKKQLDELLKQEKRSTNGGQNNSVRYFYFN